MDNLWLVFSEFLLLLVGVVVTVIAILYFLTRRKGEGANVRLGVSLKKIVRNPVFMFLIVVSAFILAFASIFFVKIKQMQEGGFFLEDITPAFYWVGVSIITSSLFLMLRFLDNKRCRTVFIFSSILLMTSIRMIFPVVFTTITAYEPDVANYMNVANSWVTSGIDFGKEGNYQHDYPMSFLIAYVFLKLGISLESFFRLAPFFLYAINLVLMYLIGSQISLEDKKNAAVAAFLFSFSSLNYWNAVHYSPDLVGTSFFLLSLYLVVKLVIKQRLNLVSLLPVLLSIFILILSHHLSTLYLIVTLFGLSFSSWFTKSSLKGKEKWFLLLGVYTYTLWFGYGSFIYPSFFNVYIYLQTSINPISLAQSATLLDIVSFIAYPMFILGLFVYMLLKVLKVQKVSDVVRLFKKVRESVATDPYWTTLVYSLGFIFVGGLFLLGFAIPNIFPFRILEVLIIGLCPVSSLTLIQVANANPSKKRTLLMFVLTVFVVLLSIHRYYRQIQGRVLGK